MWQFVTFPAWVVTQVTQIWANKLTNLYTRIRLVAWGYEAPYTNFTNTRNSPDMRFISV